MSQVVELMTLCTAAGKTGQGQGHVKVLGLKDPFSICRGCVSVESVAMVTLNIYSATGDTNAQQTK